jgi:formyl-CoA transferase
MDLPLQGIKVLDLTRALAGPFCTMILGDMGADVVKVEPLPEGEMVRGWGPYHQGISCFFLSINRNKRSLAVDFRQPGGLETLRRMAANADVVVENFKPGAVEAMGLDFATLKADNPRLIYGSITAFGSSGPYGSWPGLDQIAQGMSGLMSLTGTQESGPVRVGIPIADVVAGMWLAIGMLTAVLHRERTGAGQRVDTSLLAGLVAMLNVQGQRNLSLGEVPGVVGNDHPVISPYGLFHAADGPLNVAAPTTDMWRRLCALLGAEALADDPDFADNTARARNRDALRERLNGRFATRTRSEWITLLNEQGIPAGPIYDLEQLFADPQVRHAGLVEEVHHPLLGMLKLLGNPLKLGAMTAPSVRRPPALLGEHSAEALRDYGWTEEEIQALEQARVVKCAEKESP